MSAPTIEIGRVGFGHLPMSMAGHVQRHEFFADPHHSGTVLQARAIAKGMLHYGLQRQPRYEIHWFAMSRAQFFERIVKAAVFQVLQLVRPAPPAAKLPPVQGRQFIWQPSCIHRHAKRRDLLRGKVPRISLIPEW